MKIAMTVIVLLGFGALGVCMWMAAATRRHLKRDAEEMKRRLNR